MLTITWGEHKGEFYGNYGSQQMARVRVLNFLVLKLISAIVISIKSPFIMKNYSIHEIQCHCQYWEMLQEWVCPFVLLL